MQGKSGKFREIQVTIGKMTAIDKTAVGVTAVENDLKL